MLMLNITQLQAQRQCEGDEHPACVLMQGDHKPGTLGVLRDFYEHGKLWEFCTTSGKIFNKQNSFNSVEYLRDTTRFCASNKQSREFWRCSQCVGNLVTSCNAGNFHNKK